MPQSVLILSPDAPLAGELARRARLGDLEPVLPDEGPISPSLSRLRPDVVLLDFAHPSARLNTVYVAAREIGARLVAFGDAVQLRHAPRGGQAASLAEVVPSRDGASIADAALRAALTN